MGHSSFRDLIAWRRARHLVPIVYKLTDTFPREEQYGLTSQIRRAAHSVPLNLAEGSGRLSNGEWQQFLGQSRASLMELESGFIQAYDLKYVTREQLEPFFVNLQEVAKLINGLLRASAGKRPKKFSTVESTVNC